MIKPQGRFVSIAYVRDFSDCDGEPDKACEVCGKTLSRKWRTCHLGDMHVQGAFLSFEQYPVGSEVDLSGLQGYEEACRDLDGLLGRIDEMLTIESVTVGYEGGESLYNFAPKFDWEESDG